MEKSTTVIAYGRVSTVQQSRQNRYQRQMEAIKTAFNIKDMDFAYDVAKESTPWKQLPALHGQLQKASHLGTPLHIEHSDRLLKSCNEQMINLFLKQLKQFGVEIRIAHPNDRWHRLIIKILTNGKPLPRRKRSLVRILDRYLLHRHAVISPYGCSDNLPPLQSTRTLKKLVYYPALTACADRLLELDPLTLSPRSFNFFVDAYLGHAYNHKRHIQTTSGRIFVRDGQRTYPSCPEHLEIFALVRRVESAPLFTAAGRPKRVSDQAVAHAVNAAGFRNLRGHPFSRKSVWYIRRSPSYHRFCAGDLDLSFLLVEAAP